MCGIIAYIGKRNAADVILDGLSRLEYRGYDSAGISLQDTSGRLSILRAVGRLDQLVAKVTKAKITGHIGIGHTRWATHGKTLEVNAHPHQSADGRVALVHNGIIENYLALKNKYLKSVELYGDTDTEIAANVLAKQLRGAKTLHDVLRKGMKLFHGSYAICAQSADFPDEIAVARVGSPMILGVGDGEYFVASDVPAILPYTNKIIYLDENESARLTPSGIEVFDAQGKPKSVRPQTVNLSVEAAEKGGYEHFMLKEINEQPAAIEATILGRIGKGSTIDLRELGLTKAQVKRVKRIQLLACGTSYHSAVVARYALQEFAKIPTEAHLANEYTYSEQIVDKHTLAIAISQSGETIDTKLALEKAKKAGAQTLAICNVVGSSMTRVADATLYTRAGIEIGVASTKAYTTQITALMLLTFWLGRQQEALSASAEQKFVREIRKIPALMRGLLESKHVGVKRCASRYQNCNNFMYIGRRYNFATAFEGALKLKEISYIHAEGYGASEMKHGPIALVDGAFPTIVICPASTIHEKTVSNIREIKSRDGVIVAIASDGDEEVRDLADYLIYVPKTPEYLSPLLTVVPLQLLAYYTAVNRGCDPDKPRNLAKAVTVE